MKQGRLDRRSRRPIAGERRGGQTNETSEPAPSVPSGASRPAPGQPVEAARDGARLALRDPRFIVEVVLAILIAVLVYVQTQRIAEQAAAQNEALLGWSANQENIRFVRETVISGSPEMPFEKLDLSYATFRGLHFGCTDRERLKANSWRDPFASPNYTGARCREDFSSSNLNYADMGGAQMYAAEFHNTTLYGASLASANIGLATFRFANLN